MNLGGTTSIPTNSIEPIEIQIVGHDGFPLLSKTDICLRLRRISDDLFLDWTDNTFKAAPSATQLHLPLVEVGPYTPGIYRVNSGVHSNGLHLALITNANPDDIYDATIIQIGGGSDAAGLPVGFEMKIGNLADKIAGLPTNVANAVWNSLQTDHTISGSFGDLLQRIVALQKENYYIDNMTYNTQGLMLTGRIRLFHTRALALAATPAGTGEGEFATYSFNTTPVGGHPERAATARSVRDP